MNNVFVGDFELFLFEVGISWGSSHLRHVEDLKHGIEVEVLHIQTLQDDLSYDEINVLLLEFNLLKEV